ncbi:porin family protein [uncultured Psychroserpens sp.]|uniref:porin family protein n=1 Tax=uncultured Psychroserpens sp. TaxID=255436 RepID=UPI00261209FB|nr:porin family protein [uncultured Psychroserpens sp.]
MKPILYLIIVLVSFQTLSAQSSQEGVKKTDSIVDRKYREDQFYASVTYNLLGNKPSGVSQSGFSSGFHFGFIRDMPINERRNVAIGIGLGISTNSYNQNLLISEDNGSLNYTVLEDDVSFNKNKFTTYLVEMPFEFRWRTSTAKDYDFWRIYTGIKVGYVVYNSSKFNGSPDDIKISNIDNFNAFQYGLTLSAGYSNVNFHLYYGLNTIFDTDAKLSENSNSVEMNAVKIGLIFYIL